MPPVLSKNVAPREAKMVSISRTPNPSKPYSILMKGRPDEPDSWFSISVYSKEEEAEFRGRGWKPSKEFMHSADRARRKD